MSTELDQPDLLSDLHDLDLVRHLLADLHDDLAGKIARLRQLVDLSGTLGSSGTMLSGGQPLLLHGERLAGASFMETSPRRCYFAKGLPNIYWRRSSMAAC
jgi:hypothetical protein